MLQAYLHNKELGDTEDSKTSSVWGVLQYLPDNVILSLINKLLDNKRPIHSEDKITKFEFWPRWDPTGTINDRYVEPDIYIETTNFDIIIEVKKNDTTDNPQYFEQWEKEILALQNEKNNKTNDIIFLTLGGNDFSKSDKDLIINGIRIYPISWFMLYQAIDAIKNKVSKSNYVRLLSDVEHFMNREGYSSIKWLDELCRNNKYIFPEQIKIPQIWKVKQIH